MERILIATDFSDPSRLALCTALELSRTLAAPLHVVHVIPTRLLGAELAPIVSLLSSGDIETERALLEFVECEFKGTTEDQARIDYKVLEGHEPTEILAEAERWKATLIVLGSHGRSGALEQFLGSVTSSVLSLAKVPVLIVPETGGKVLPESILAALDGDTTTDPVLHEAARWARALQARLTILHVFPEVVSDIHSGRLLPEALDEPQWHVLLERVERQVQGAVDKAFAGQLRPPLQFRVGTPCVEICAEAREGGHDLVIVGYQHQQSALDLGNTAARVAHLSPCTVLVLRPHAVESAPADGLRTD